MVVEPLILVHALNGRSLVVGGRIVVFVILKTQGSSREVDRLGVAFICPGDNQVVVAVALLIVGIEHLVERIDGLLGCRKRVGSHNGVEEAVCIFRTVGVAGDQSDRRCRIGGVAFIHEDQISHILLVFCEGRGGVARRQADACAGVVSVGRIIRDLALPYFVNNAAYHHDKKRDYKQYDRNANHIHGGSFFALLCGRTTVQKVR